VWEQPERRDLRPSAKKENQRFRSRKKKEKHAPRGDATILESRDLPNQISFKGDIEDKWSYFTSPEKIAWKQKGWGKRKPRLNLKERVATRVRKRCERFTVGGKAIERGGED